MPLDQDYYRKTLGLRPLDQRFFIISLPYTLTKNFISLVFSRSLTPKEAHQGGQKVNGQTVLMKKSDNNYSLKVLRTSSNSFGGEKILYRTHIKMQNELWCEQQSPPTRPPGVNHTAFSSFHCHRIFCLSMYNVLISRNFWLVLDTSVYTTMSISRRLPSVIYWLINFCDVKKLCQHNIWP